MMRRAVLASLFILVALQPGAAQDQSATPQDPQGTEFQSTERGFAIAFPGTPHVTSTPIRGQNPLMQHDFQVSLGKDEVYSVVVFEYPDGKAPKPDTDYYLKLVNAYAKGSETRVRRKGPATVGTRQGYEAAAEDGKGKLNHLVAIVADGDLIYMLASAGPKGHAQSKDAERFRESFRLL
ncbi:MAG: hypothetical protein ACOYB4_05855, partial [Methyloceanibacter sp.]